MAERAHRSSKRDADSTRPVRTVFLRRGTSSTVHRHDEPASWTHVVSGVLLEERWTRDAEGGFVHERRSLRRGQSIAAPGDALRRLTAVDDDAAFVTTSICDCAHADPAPRAEVAAVTRLSRGDADRAWASATAVGAPAVDPRAR